MLQGAHCFFLTIYICIGSCYIDLLTLIVPCRVFLTAPKPMRAFTSSAVSSVLVLRWLTTTMPHNFLWSTHQTSFFPSYESLIGSKTIVFSFLFLFGDESTTRGPFHCLRSDENSNRRTRNIYHDKNNPDSNEGEEPPLLGLVQVDSGIIYSCLEQSHTTRILFLSWELYSVLFL